MQQKIALYEEVLSLEPGTRLFFPLAEMYLAENMPEKAEETLRRGIAVHPDHLEAKLLLLDVLQRLGKDHEMVRVATPLVKALRSCSALWAAWSVVDGGQGEDEAALFRMLGHVLGGKSFSWAGIMAAGIGQVCGSQGGATSGNVIETGGLSADAAGSGVASDGPEIGRDLDAEEVDLAELEDDVKTRTLADLLAYQEEFEQALLIYEQLRDNATSSADRELFQSRVDEMRMKLGREEASALNAEDAVGENAAETAAAGRPAAGTQAIDTLTALAERLEQRGAVADEAKNTN